MLQSIPAIAHTAHAQNPQSIVEIYTQAYNAKDVDAMGKLMHKDIQWITISAGKSTISTEGKVNMVREMTGYFKSPPLLPAA